MKLEAAGRAVVLAGAVRIEAMRALNRRLSDEADRQMVKDAETTGTGPGATLQSSAASPVPTADSSDRGRESHVSTPAGGARGTKEERVCAVREAAAEGGLGHLGRVQDVVAGRPVAGVHPTHQIREAALHFGGREVAVPDRPDRP